MNLCWNKNRAKKQTQWIDLQVGEEQILVQVEEPHDEAGQHSAERQSTHDTQLLIGCCSTRIDSESIML